MFNCYECRQEKIEYIVRADISISRCSNIESWCEGETYRKICVECFIKKVSGLISPEKRDYNEK